MTVKDSEFSFGDGNFEVLAGLLAMIQMPNNKLTPESL